MDRFPVSSHSIGFPLPHLSPSLSPPPFPPSTSPSTRLCPRWRRRCSSCSKRQSPRSPAILETVLDSERELRKRNRLPVQWRILPWALVMVTVLLVCVCVYQLCVCVYQVSAVKVEWQEERKRARMTHQKEMNVAKDKVCCYTHACTRTCTRTRTHTCTRTRTHTHTHYRPGSLLYLHTRCKHPPTWLG